MNPLIDTDAFCKLGVAGLLQDAVEIFGARLTDCRRLPALPHMLRRGGLRRRYGESACDALIPLADQVPEIGTVSTEWLDRFALIESVDPGEAQLYAASAEQGLIVLSDDKKALRSVKDVEDLAAALAGRIAVLAAILLALCERRGADEIRRRISAVAPLDRMVQMCFSAGNSDPREGLHSYYNSLAAEVRPLVLWDPWAEGAA